MTPVATRLGIEITCVGVPEELAGVPLSFEIVSPRGAARRLLLAPEEGQRTTELVDLPGRYLVRAELPSGDRLAETVTVPEPAEGQTAFSAVTLDFSMANKSVAPQEPPAEREVLRGSTRSAELPPMLGSVLGAAPGASPIFESLSFGVNDPPLSTLSYGFFQHWIGSAPTENTLVAEARGDQLISFPGDLVLAAHPGWSSNTTQWRPLLACVKLPPVDGETETEALVVWPPSSGKQPLHLVADSSPGVNQTAAPLLASTQAEDKVTDALFAYARSGRLDTARQATAALVQQAEELLDAKKLNPVNAILAAYTLQKVGGAEHPDWLANLANWFPYLPDGALLYGWYLLRNGRAEEARGLFQTALARGIPMYSEGIRLLRDGLSFLSGLPPGNMDLQASTARAYRLADATNPRSVLTCLRLGAGLAVEWSP
jgi:hypothetical protein